MLIAKRTAADTRTLSDDAEMLVGHVASAVVARREVIRDSVVSLIAGGHLLLNDLPGVGKTLLARSLASSIGGTFKRIQFTPDLLPTDVTGSSIFNQAEGRFEFVPGPIFANVVLADEVNRASTRTQSALLEAMAEGQVTADGRSYPLPHPFWVVATQNEVDSYGTFPLPQAQLDRFMMERSIGYPTAQEEVEILERNQHGDPVLEPVLDGDRVQEMRLQVRDVEVSRPVREYIGNILASSREYPEFSLGASPRGGVQIQRSAQALAALEGSEYVAPEHVKTVAPLVLGHRIVMSPSATMSAGEAVQDLIKGIPVPL